MSIAARRVRPSRPTRRPRGPTTALRRPIAAPPDRSSSTGRASCSRSATRRPSSSTRSGTMQSGQRVVVADVVAHIGAGQQAGEVCRPPPVCSPARRKALAALRLRVLAPPARAAPANASSPAPPPDSARTRRCRADPSGAHPFTTAASFQPRLTASCMPRFNPGPPIGECTCAASPTQQHPSASVAFGLPGVHPVEAAQRVRPWLFRRLQRDVDAEHAAETLAQLVERHRPVGTAGRPAVLDGAEHRPVPLQREEDDAAVVEPAGTERPAGRIRESRSRDRALSVPREGGRGRSGSRSATCGRGSRFPCSCARCCARRRRPPDSRRPDGRSARPI